MADPCAYSICGTNYDLFTTFVSSALKSFLFPDEKTPTVSVIGPFRIAHVSSLA